MLENFRIWQIFWDHCTASHGNFYTCLLDVHGQARESGSKECKEENLDPGLAVRLQNPTGSNLSPF